MAIMDVIKYNGSPDLLVWKYPSEELGTWTQLIVNESQEAVLYKGGKALDVFQSGRHTLDTANIPLLSKIINLPFGGRSPFTAEVWYVNKVFSLDVKWGTATPIQIQDPQYKIFCPVRANGIFGIQVEDSRKFLIKLVGTLQSFDKQTLVKYFRGLCATKVKDVLSSYIIRKKVSIVEINAYIDELSTYMKERIAPEMAEYGIRLVNFYVNDISTPEDDPSVIKLKDALAKRAEMNIVGSDYAKERSYDVLEKGAQNSGNPLMGPAMVIGMGEKLGEMYQNIDISGSDATKECPKCHKRFKQSDRYCGSCGYDTMKELEAEKSETQKIVIKCRKCDYELEKGMNFCPNCGKKYNPCPQCGMDMEEGEVTCPECGYEFPLKCPKCGEEILRDVKFCPHCGQSLVKTCPNCGKPVEENDKFCSHCGESL